MRPLARRSFLQFSSATTLGATLETIASTTAPGSASTALTSALSTSSSARLITRPLKYVHTTGVEGEYCTNCMYLLAEDGTEFRQCGTFPQQHQQQQQQQ